MIEKNVEVRGLEDPSSPARDRKWWLSRSAEERLEAVEIVRNKKAVGRTRDIAEIEALGGEVD